MDHSTAIVVGLGLALGLLGFLAADVYNGIEYNRRNMVELASWERHQINTLRHLHGLDPEKWPDLRGGREGAGSGGAGQLAVAEMASAQE